MIPAFAKKHDQDLEDKVELLPSFITANIIHNEYNKMIKEYKERKRTEKEKKEARIEAMN